MTDFPEFWNFPKNLDLFKTIFRNFETFFFGGGADFKILIVFLKISQQKYPTFGKKFKKSISSWSVFSDITDFPPIFQTLFSAKL